MFLGPCKEEFPIFVFRGMSGISTATAITQNFRKKFDGKFGMMYVRKPEEESHGRRIETSNVGGITDENVRFVFCDDFISGGDTVANTLNSIQEKFSLKINANEVLVALSDERAVRDLSNSPCFERVNKLVEEKHAELQAAREAELARVQEIISRVPECFFSSNIGL